MHCRCCGGVAFELVLSVPDVRYAPQGRRFDVVRCTQCRVMATRDGADLVDPSSHYPGEYESFAAAAPPRRPPRARLPWLPQVAPGRLAWLADVRALAPRGALEVGAGAGAVALAVSQACGCRVTAVEADAAAAARARAAGLEVHAVAFEAFETPERFDLVLFVHALEHLREPLAALRRAHALLRPGGRLVLATPNAEAFERRLFGPWWDGWDVPRHVHHFGPDSLLALVERAGFAPLALRWEAYSLLARGLGNRWLASRPYAERARALRLRPLEAAWGLALAALRTSSAIQLIAEPRAASG